MHPAQSAGGTIAQVKTLLRRSKTHSYQTYSSSSWWSLPTSSGPAHFVGFGGDPVRADSPLSAGRLVRGKGIIEKRGVIGRRGILGAPRCRCRGPLEVLAQRVCLSLVRGSDGFTVQDIRVFDHPLEGQLTHSLAMLDHERHVVGPHLQGRA